MITPRLNAGQPIVEADDTMAQAFRQWTQQASLSIPIVGTGSPEGAISALQYSLYIDETTPLAPVEYRKMLPSIAGDVTQGWAAI